VGVIAAAAAAAVPVAAAAVVVVAAVTVLGEEVSVVSFASPIVATSVSTCSHHCKQQT